MAVRIQVRDDPSAVDIPDTVRNVAEENHTGRMGGLWIFLPREFVRDLDFSLDGIYENVSRFWFLGWTA